MFVFLEGQFQVRGELGGETVVIPINSGDVTGVLPFSRMKQFTVGGKAITDCRVLRFPASQFPELVQKMPELTQRLVGMMSDSIRETTRREQQRDRLASLGKLSAGLAHELNNPASAAKRAASQLRDVLRENPRCQPRAGQPRPHGGAESGNREAGDRVRPERHGSAGPAGHERSGRADRFAVAQSRTE